MKKKANAKKKAVKSKPAKKAKKPVKAKKPAGAAKPAAPKGLVGRVSHYYDHIGVAVVELKDTLKQGDRILIKGHAGEFEQAVSSMQIDHEQVLVAKKGDAVGLKVDQPVKQNMEVYKAK